MHNEQNKKCPLSFCAIKCGACAARCSCPPTPSTEQNDCCDNGNFGDGHKCQKQPPSKDCCEKCEWIGYETDEYDRGVGLTSECRNKKCPCHSTEGKEHEPKEELVTCKRCKKTMSKEDSIHSCKPQPPQEGQEEITPEDYKCGGCGKCEACLIYAREHPQQEPHKESWEDRFDNKLAKLGDVLELSGITIVKNFIRTEIDTARREGEATWKDGARQSYENGVAFGAKEARAQLIKEIREEVKKMQPLYDIDTDKKPKLVSKEAVLALLDKKEKI